MRLAAQRAQRGSRGALIGRLTVDLPAVRDDGVAPDDRLGPVRRARGARLAKRVGKRHRRGIAAIELGRVDGPYLKAHAQALE